MSRPAKITARQQRILDLIEATAAAGKACPTNDRLAELADIAPHKIATVMKDMREGGLIVVETVHCARRVTIVATGAQTAALPKPRPLSADRAAQ